MRVFGSLVVLCCVVSCSALQGPQMVDNAKDSHLPRLDPIKVGYSRDYNIFQTSAPKNPGHVTKIITLSMKPPIFEIPKFMTTEECDHLLNYAKRLGFKKSPQIKDEAEISEETSEKTFQTWDYDNDGFITPREIAWLPGKSDLYVTEEDIIKMFDDLQMDTDHDGVISFEEFQKVTVPAITAYFDKLREIPHMRSRNSEQAWMFHDNPKYPLLADFHGRLHRLTGLPKHIIRNSEPVQVVKYDVHGHYHSHHDSDDLHDKKPCCTLNIEENCRLCRYMTVLVFLNEPEEGGETAFPFANNRTFSQEALKVEGHKLNLAKHCYDGNLVVTPQKGKAIMWYNHHRNPRSGWLGNLDLTSYHGGCDVTKGTKWIANLWFDVIGKPGSEESYKGWLHAGAEKKTKKDEL